MKVFDQSDSSVLEQWMIGPEVVFHHGTQMLVHRLDNHFLHDLHLSKETKGSLDLPSDQWVGYLQ